jgi:hypothetical protein
MSAWSLHKLEVIHNQQSNTFAPAEATRPRPKGKGSKGRRIINEDRFVG